MSGGVNLGTVLCGVAVVVFAGLAVLSFVTGDAGLGAVYLLLAALWVGMAVVLQRRRGGSGRDRR